MGFFVEKFGGGRKKKGAEDGFRGIGWTCTFSHFTWRDFLFMVYRETFKFSVGVRKDSFKYLGQFMH